MGPDDLPCPAHHRSTGHPPPISLLSFCQQPPIALPSFWSTNTQPDRWGIDSTWRESDGYAHPRNLLKRPKQLLAAGAHQREVLQEVGPDRLLVAHGLRGAVDHLRVRFAARSCGCSRACPCGSSRGWLCSVLVVPPRNDAKSLGAWSHPYPALVYNIREGFAALHHTMRGGAFESRGENAPRPRQRGARSPPRAAGPSGA